MKLKDKIAIITGASSGIGRETALLFAKEGASVVVTARREERLEELVKISKDFAGTIIPLAGDVAKEEDLQKIIDVTMDNFGRIDILVNNAGILDDFTPIANLTDELWNNVIKINLTSPMSLCRKAIPIMLKQKSGNTINVSSVGGLHGSRAGAAYTASKHGLVGLTKNIGYMYANDGIRCNVVCPGGVDTEITNNLHADDFGVGRVMAGANNSPRSGSSEEIANTLLFLASDDSSLINGATIVADAGWTAY